MLQYTGFHATQELATFALWNRAAESRRVPGGARVLRRRLAELGLRRPRRQPRLLHERRAAAAHRPRAGRRRRAAAVLRARRHVGRRTTGSPTRRHSQGQTIPFAVLPADEMPQTVNPENGFFVNANNDPAGTSLDNDPLNQVRVSSANAIYYLNPGYADGLRAGRITRLIQDELAGGGTVDANEMKEFQTQHAAARRRAARAVPARGVRRTRRRRARRPSSPRSRRGRGSPRRSGASSTWDFSTPTGHRGGLDARDVNGLPHRGGRLRRQRGRRERRRDDLQPVARLCGARRSSTRGSSGFGARRRLAPKRSRRSTTCSRQTPYTGVGRRGLRLDPAAGRALGRAAARPRAARARCATRSTRSRRPRSRRPSPSSTDQNALPLGQAAPDRVRLT